MGDFKFDDYIISTDKNLLHFETIQGFLSRSYWAHDRTMEQTEKTIENSLCFGIYQGSRQIAFARVISDLTTMYYLCDVFIDEEFRGKGLGKKMVAYITQFDSLRNLTGMLRTKDAHDLYEQYGFTKDGDRFMRKVPNE
jgi:GNAT superfamily N-acetyltransferase